MICSQREKHDGHLPGWNIDDKYLCSKYAHNGECDGELLYCQEGLGENECVADRFLFACKYSSGICINDGTWRCNEKQIRKFLGKDKYSIADARKVIKHIRENPEYIYACIGVKTLESFS